MIKKNLTVLLIEDSPDYAELVQRWLSLRDDIGFRLSWADSLAAGLERLAQGGVDVILLDLGLPDSEGLPTFTRTRLHAAGVPIILLSGEDSDALALQMVHEGAQDYIAKASCTGEMLSRAIQYAVVRYDGQAEKKGPAPALNLTRVIGVMGAKGGTGTTTVACHLAVELQRQTGQKTLLLDLDIGGGMVGFLMNLSSPYSVLDAVDNVHHMDTSFWGGIVAQGPGDLHVVPAPSLSARAEPTAESLHHVIASIRTLYRWIVIDFGRLTGLSLALLDSVNELFVVSTSGIPAIYEARRMFSALKDAGLGGDRLRLIVNQHAKTELVEAELDRVFGFPVYARLPGAARELEDACVRRKLSAENSEFRAAIIGLARKMAGLPTGKSKNRVSQIFSFADKARATGAATPHP